MNLKAKLNLILKLIGLMLFAFIFVNERALIAEQTSRYEAQETTLVTYLKSLNETQQAISEERQQLLQGAALEIRKAIADRGSVDLIFVCTHNSRRSQLAQIWAALAAEQFGLKSVCCFSCGTEATACNARTIAALERAGLRFTKTGDEANPVYHLATEDRSSNIDLFSKVFEHPSLPKNEFVAMMCCDHADKNCPNIRGASYRIPLWYVDPKVSDDRSDEAMVYDERCRQIAAEMFLLMKLVGLDRS